MSWSSLNYLLQVQRFNLFIYWAVLCCVVMDLTKLNAAQLTLYGSAFCVMLSMHFTLQLLSQHLFYWKNPKEQRAIVIIILMAPIYAIVSFVGLLDVRGSKEFFTLLESVKECYEALVIAKFLSLMYSYLKISISKNIVPDEIKGREIHHSFPMTLFQVWPAFCTEFSGRMNLHSI